MNKYRTVGYLTQDSKPHKVELSEDAKVLHVWFQYDLDEEDYLELDVEEVLEILDVLYTAVAEEAIAS